MDVALARGQSELISLATASIPGDFREGCHGGAENKLKKSKKEIPENLRWQTDSHRFVSWVHTTLHGPGNSE